MYAEVLMNWIPVIAPPGMLRDPWVSSVHCEGAQKLSARPSLRTAHFPRTYVSDDTTLDISQRNILVGVSSSAPQTEVRNLRRGMTMLKYFGMYFPFQFWPLRLSNSGTYAVDDQSLAL